MNNYEHITSLSSIEPLMPDAAVRELEDKVVELITKSSSLAGKLNLEVIKSIGTLIRSMNCYYSNLIEGHNTLPVDIDRAMRNEYSSNPEKRNLQLEAVAHINVQKLIDDNNYSHNITSPEMLLWIHKEFYEWLPEELKWIENPITGQRIKVEAGQLRSSDVKIGNYIPPIAESLPAFLARFENVYNPNNLSKVRQVIAAAASHHRLLWIHPFYDGNGRVTRLFSHAYLKSIGIGNNLWSISRGLARRAANYKALLMQADMTRQGDLDGRGNLTLKGLISFCQFFLETCIDQIDYMASILEPSELLTRMELYCEEEIRASRLPKGSFPLLREVLLSGAIDRGRAAAITGYKERQARTVLGVLLDKGLLVSDSSKKPVRLGFPIQVVDRWFPKLYPAAS